MVELLVCRQNTTRLSIDARDYLLSLLGKNGGYAAATSISSYHGDDNEDDDDDVDDDGFDDEDDCSVFEAASRISPVEYFR